MADEKKEPWLNWLAFTTVLLAVCATLATSRGGSYSTRAVLSQARAANQWAYYQSKSIKGYLYEIQKEELELESRQDGGRRPAAGGRAVEERLAAYRSEVARYDREKAEIQAEARRYEEVCADAQKHSQTFGVAVIYLQVAILLSSVAALLRKKRLWQLALLPGAVGVWYFVNGFLLVSPRF